MSRKKWGLFFLAALALIIAAWAAVNILVDPFGVYGDVLFHWDSYSQTLNSRNGKAAYLSQRFEDYDSYVIGSGAASAYTPEILETYLGGSFYNLFHDEADPEYDAQLVAYLLEQDPENPVKIDSPETMAGIRAVRELAGILEKQEPCFSYLDSFVSGKTAFLLSEREILCYLKHRNFDDWGVVPMPRMPGGTDKMSQATDLLCVRKECVDSDMIRGFLAFMLSEEVQDYIAAEKYGIPIRKSSAQKTIDITDRRDLLFLTEMNNMFAEYNLDSPELMNLIQSGISQIIREQERPLEKSLKRLADAVRIFLEIKNTNRKTA